MNDKSLRKKYLDRAEKGVERLIYNRTTTWFQIRNGDLNLITPVNLAIVELVQNVFTY
jgi:two-component system phosphate regulon sensor histidine kinase PhoR